MIDFSIQTATAFDADAAQLRKEWGMGTAADARKELLNECRAAVRKAALGRDDRTATADDSSRYLLSIGLPVDALGNAAGSLFRSGWIFTGKYQPSTRTTNHGHSNRVWKLVEW